MDTNAAKSEKVLVLDFGSQYTHLITRRIRSLSILSLCVSGIAPLATIAEHNPKVVILSGGPHSVHLPNSPSFDPGFLEWAQSNGVFVLGICYGMQLLVQRLGGEVRVGEKQEYGRMGIAVENNSGIFGNKKVGDQQTVWMSHGDEAAQLPEGFEIVARSQEGLVAAAEDRNRRFYGLQYHPEVTHSEEGIETLQYFLLDICGMSADWKMEDLLEEKIKQVKATVGPDDHVICALSGGVDSTVAATLVHEAIGDRLHCVFVDNGLLRYKERERVMETFEKDLHLPVTCRDETKRFLDELKGVSDPEAKRKKIAAEFINVFDEFAQELELKIGKKPAFLVQGTVYADVIESGADGAHSNKIKTHHNVGVPKNMRLKLIEPLRLLFKDEVRELGRVLKVPDSFLKRHPFPGPGLAVRIEGDVTAGNDLEIARQADEIFIRLIRNAGLYDSIWLAGVCLPDTRPVGVQGDKRTCDRAVFLRAVTSEDGMTAKSYYFEPKFIQEVESRIMNNVRGVSRVGQDFTSKPPGTIEWV